MTETAEAKRGRGRPPKVEEDLTAPVLIHVLKDGFCAFQHVWMAGQEIEVPRDSDYYKKTLDRDGNSWLDYSDKKQQELWNEVRFRKGESPIPNPFLEYWENFNPDGRTYRKGEYLDKKMLEQEAQRERERGRSIPKFF